jgi:hypothetical protein
LLLIDLCVAHLKNTTFLCNIKAVFLPPNCSSQLQHLDLGIIHAFKCHYREQLIQKTVAMIDAVKPNENDEDDWHNLQPLAVQFEDHTTCDSALEVCGIQSVGQVLDQHLARPEEEEEGGGEEIEGGGGEVEEIEKEGGGGGEIEGEEIEGEEKEEEEYKATFLDALKGLEAAGKVHVAVRYQEQYHHNV